MKTFKSFVTEISQFKRDEIAFELRHEDPHGTNHRSYAPRGLHAVHYLKNTGKDPSNPEHREHMMTKYGAEHSEKSGWHIKDRHGFRDHDVAKAKKDFGAHNVKTWIPKN